MSVPSVIFAAARADFLERARSFRFLAVLMATVATGMLMLPTADAGYVVLSLGNARGVYGSAWIGLVFGVVGAMVLPLFGFFIVKDALARDRATRVGLILAALPLGRFAYLSAKLLSNFSVFVAILSVSSVVAFGMQFWRAEDLALHPVDLLAHLWLVALPIVLLTSAVALLFECVPGLRGAFGNVVFFFAWSALMGTGMNGMTPETGRIITRSADLYGISAPLGDFEDQLETNGLKPDEGLSMGVNIGAKPPKLVHWKGITSDGPWLAGRLLWTLACLPILLLAALFFDRFDPSRVRRRTEKAPAVGSEQPAALTPWHTLTPMPAFAAGWRPLTMLRAELALLLKRRSVWWYGVVAILWIVGAANETEIAMQWLVPLAWLWGITGFSEHGARAEIHGTRALLASASSPLLRQLPVQWLAGSLFALVLVAPVFLILLLTAPSAAAQLAVGAGFVSALSLALGALSCGSRLFELVFLSLSYLAMQPAPGTRFFGNPELSFSASLAPTYLLIGALLLASAALLRRLSMRG